MSSYRKKIVFVATIMLLLVAGFLITSVTSFSVARKALRSEIRENELPLTSDNVYSEIRSDLIHPIVISSFMANDTFVRDWVLNGEKDEAKITKYLKEVQEQYGGCSSFFVSDKTLTYYHADGVLKTVSPDEPRDAWYYRVRSMTPDYEINIDPDLANRDLMTIFINHRVSDYDGNFIGATGVGMTVNAVLDLIEIYQAKYGRAVYFFDAQGHITLAGSKFDSSVTSVDEFDSPDLYTQAIQSKEETSFSYKKGGKTIHANVRYIPEWAWFLAVEKADGRAVRGISDVLLLSLVICGVMTLVVTVLVNSTIGRYQRRIAMLHGILPICSHCDKVRDENGEWCKVERYVARHTGAEFSHSICPSCMKTHYPEV